ncbi:MAG TPA: asparagine synthase (glutamine-hydrolyzing), partial [Blastocatellia bacterium]|nr:asparagine synthase (glutamine-hydrolyzing) [Blastocatellia bacterium]
MIERMCDAITHRGPDDWGSHVETIGDQVVSIGMRRLSIIDVASGHQPIANEDNSVWIVFNGEIYNYRELRDDLIARGHRFRTRTDTETIVHLYEEEGERCVEKLRGMFTFAIWDRRDHSLFLARDRAGKKPMHYTQSGDHFVFGSEIKSILQHPAVKREVNLEAISDFLTYGYVPDPRTAFNGIHKLPPGHTLTYKNGQIRTRRYWDFGFGSAVWAQRLTEAEHIERLRELLAESVRIRLESEVPLGAFLSGGIDSSLVVALMAREMQQPVKTFSIGFKESGFDELKYAKVTAKLLNTDHHEFVVTPNVCQLVEEIIWHHDEPFADVSSIPTYVVSKMAREYVTVVLSGDGGDELFGGYERYAVERQREKFHRIPRFIRYGLMRPLSAALPEGFYGKRFLGNIALDLGERYVDNISYFNEEAKRALLASTMRAALNGYEASNAYHQLYLESGSEVNLERQLYLDSKTYLPGDILVKVDRMSMAQSIETRAPLLDHRLIEYAQTIPASLKLRRTGNGIETKYILKRAAAGLIPDEIINRPKQGFDVPIRKWLNGELREMLDDTLNSRSLHERGYFNSQAVQSIVNEHRQGVRDHARHLWGLLTLELWHRSFIDRKP